MSTATVVLAVGGCARGADPAQVSGDTARSGATASAGRADGTPTATATRPPDALAANVPSLRRSDAARAGKRLVAAPVGFDRSATYSDGVTLRIVSTADSSSEDSGPGSFVGAPVTTFTVELRNGSSTPLRLDQVVATLTYGQPARVASPVYDDGVVDLSGVVSKGATAKAVYAFSVPQDGRTAQDVRLAIDFDGQHAASTFAGRL